MATSKIGSIYVGTSKQAGFWFNRLKLRFKIEKLIRKRYE